MALPVVPLAIAGAAALFLLLRKKKDAFTVTPASGSPAAAFAPSSPASSSTSVPSESDQSEEDQVIVEEALAQFASERGARFDAPPLVEQTVERFVSRPPPVSVVSSAAQDNFIDPGTGLRTGMNEGFDAPEPPSTLASVVSFFDPFGDED